MPATEWRPYFGLHLDPYSDSFVVMLNDTDTRMLRSWRHVEGVCPECGGRSTEELSSTKSRRSSDAEARNTEKVHGPTFQGQDRTSAGGAESCQTSRADLRLGRRHRVLGSRMRDTFKPWGAVPRAMRVVRWTTLTLVLPALFAG